MDMKKLTEAFTLNGYIVKSFKTGSEATKYLADNIQNKSVGFGDSITLAQIKLQEKLRVHNEVFSPEHATTTEEFLDCAKKCLTTQIFVTSVNALSETGQLINIDGTGNRVAGSLFGHEKVYFVVGTNKVAPTLEAAMWRARNIAAPKNAQRLQLKTPCAKKGERCYDCSSLDRICNGIIIHYKKMRNISMEIILIDEPLGF